MKKEIRFCLPVGEYWFLSPHAETPIEMKVDGRTYRFNGPEHYYQAMKFKSTDARFHEILGMKNSDEARLLTKRPEYGNDRRPDFEKNKFDIMREAQVAKFEQNPAVAKLLLSTEDAILIKSCDTCAKCGFGEGSGINALGKILMAVRADLQKAANSN